METKLKWEDALELRKQIFRHWSLQDLKQKNFGFFCHLDQELCMKTGINIRRPDFDMLNKFLKDPNAMIDEILPRNAGWRY